MSTPLTDEQLAAIKERADKATPGPWAREYLDVHTAGIRIADFETLGDNADDWRQMEADADFSAHARQDVPALLAEVKRLRSLTSECCCDPNYASYDGPRIDCAVHGAMRGMDEAHAAIEGLRAELTRLVRLWRQHDDESGDYDRCANELDGLLNSGETP